jgi:hypothetical protein
MKKFKKVLGYLILSQILTVILLVASVSDVKKYGLFDVLLGAETITLIVVFVVYCGSKAIDWITED